MCGILGLCKENSAPTDLEVVVQAVTLLSHRGPDDEGYLLATTNGEQVLTCGGLDTPSSLHLQPIQTRRGLPFNLMLGFRRLSILDLSSSGHQPMSYANGHLWIVFNGEVYNYLELRSELSSFGYQFCTNTDTEVVLASYQHWGVECLSHFTGMWAFAIWDRQKRSLLIARDPFGIKPLYYTFDRDCFAFASEIGALLELSNVDRKVNPSRLYSYLRHGLTDHGDQTLFANVFQLPAAHYLLLTLDSPSRFSVVRYWTVDLNRRTEISFPSACEQLREIFLKSVRLHLRSDVPIGAALSGGIDSSSIVMAMRHVQGQGLQLHTFSYIADDPEISEEPWIDLVGRAAGAEVHKVHPTPDDLLSDLGHLIHTQGEPFGSTSIYAQYRVFQLAHERGIKVMLDGQGADEILAGYRYYLADRMASLIRQGKWVAAGEFLDRASKWPGVGRKSLFLRAVGSLVPPHQQAPLRYLVGRHLVPSWLNATWFNEHHVRPDTPGYTRGREVLRQSLSRTLVETSLPHLLRYEDHNSMAFSVESRVPFLTTEMVEFVLSLPEEYIVGPDGTSKSVFRGAMRGIVPDTILDRRDKIGFATPERAWLTVLRPWVEQTLLSETAIEIPALCLKQVMAEWEAVACGRKRFGWHIWRWLNLIEWTRQFDVRFE